jgi:outer membrane receptor protein involved in Fe transport
MMKGYLLATACLVALGVATPALCQTEGQPAAETNVDEVIISATRRDENIQDVPISVTAYQQEELTAKGVVGFEGLAVETPGVVLNRPTANFNNFTARGVATNGYGANLQGTVAVYIDELPISTIGNSTNIDPTLFDVERVEFLRGPQGTLFGSGSLAGALRILTKRPDLNEFDMSALVDLGQTDGDALRQRYNVMVNAPIVKDTLGLRVVGFYRDEEGWVDNIGTGKDNSNTLIDWGGRATLLWEPTDRLSIKVLASYEKSTPEDSGLINPALGWDKRRSDRPDLFVGKLTNYNVTVDYQFDGAKLTSSSTWSSFDQKFFVDLAGTFGGAIAFGLDAMGYMDTFVEEARLVSDPGGKWDWSIGGFYLDRRLDVDYMYRSREDFLALRGITGLTDEYYQKQYTHFLSHEKALFGELTYRFTDDLWATGGLRYGSVDAQGFTEGGYNSNYLVNALFFIPGPLTITTIPEAKGRKVEATDPSWKFSVSWRPVPTMTTYFTYSTGFRTPVVNAFGGRPSLIDPTDLIIPAGADSDDLTNYELGLKGRWFDGKLYANLALYYIDWQNIQVQANRVSDSVQFATNIGGAVSKGFEWEIVALPVEGLTLGLNGSVNEAKVTDLTAQEAAISGAEKGSRLAFPRFQASAYVNYRWNFSDNVEGNVSLVYAHVGSFPGSFPNTPGRPTVPSPVYDKTDSWDVVNGAFAVAFNKVTVGAYVENLFDDHAITYVHPEAFLDGRYATQRPRTVGVRVSYDF